MSSSSVALPIQLVEDAGSALFAGGATAPPSTAAGVRVIAYRQGVDETTQFDGNGDYNNIDLDVQQENPSDRVGQDVCYEEIQNFGGGASRGGAGSGPGGGVGAGAAWLLLADGHRLARPNPSPLSSPHRHVQCGRITKPRHRSSGSKSIIALVEHKRSLSDAREEIVRKENVSGAEAEAEAEPEPEPGSEPAAEPGTEPEPESEVEPEAQAQGRAEDGKDGEEDANTTLFSSSLTTATPTATIIATEAMASSTGEACVQIDSLPVFSFWGPDPVPLPSRFARIKRSLIHGYEAELEACWGRLITALRAEMDHIEGLGAHLIPSIEFSDIQDPAQTSRFGHDLRRYGVGVIRKVVPKPEAAAVMRETVQYLDSKRNIKPLLQDPTCFDFYWTPAQVHSRAHPNVLRAQRFMMGLWDVSPNDQLVTRLPITYVDRIRIHGADDQQPHGVSIPSVDPPQSADDWINALQSSAGIIAQVDNGSLERWEPDGYQHAGTYNHIFRGCWEDHDPWECSSRISATMDLYNGYGACTIFRMFQGVFALSTIEPGIIRLLPSPKLAAAYYLLRPFFTHRTPPPDVRSGPAWEAYLAPENWKLEKDPDTIIHGAVPGHAQRITEHWHPHLNLRGSMITLPTLQPGDYILWHPDLPYHISSSNPGLRTPNSNDDDVSMLIYLPAAPLTQTNALYLARQRKAFQRGHPGPDFDSTGRGSVVEDAETRPGETEIARVGGAAALRAMGLAPWEVAGDSKHSTTEDVDMDITDSPSLSCAEDEVVRLANIILFPDHSMTGYSV